MRKHAYLIIAYHQFDVLKKIISLLDSEYNDFYIHIDKKTENVPFEDIKSAARLSEVTFVERIATNWGGYSLVECEMILLQAAGEKHYGYYHLLSGTDMPLKPRREIYEFFERSPETEYVLFNTQNTPREIINRVAHYHPLVDHPGYRKRRDKLSTRLLKHAIDKGQSLLGISRIRKNGLKVMQGAQWFSITDGLAQYMLENRSLIREYFSCTLCPDEIFLHTMLMRSPYKDNLSQKDMEDCDYHYVMRLVDWRRGHPYVFRSGDIEELMSTDYLFARKFEKSVDSRIIDMLYDSITEIERKRKTIDKQFVSEI